jgi:beta-glucanase (GH16 family)
MRKTYIFVLLCGLAAPLSAKTSQEMAQEGWKLTFADEFDQPTLNSGRWVTHYFFPEIINNELQAYIPGAFSLSDGILHITAKHEEAMQNGKLQHFTSGVMTTDHKFSQLYGHFEIRCKLPKGQGFWPAFWLLTDGDKWPPEIDIFENLGHQSNILYFSTHWRNPDGSIGGKTQQTTGPDYTTSFHTVAVDWQPQRITWYVDDQEQCHVTDHIPQEKMYILVNLAVGGKWPGSPNATTPFPSSFDVDYVRVYQKSPPAAAAN